jgi:Carboxypeptidase regulatory-like domain
MKQFLCLLLLILCLVPPFLFSQSTSATISGGVTDPTGNFITDASVEVVNDETGVRYSVQTNSSGMYFVPILPPGHYRVQVSRQGFKTIIKSDVVLNVQGAIALNFVLPVGATSQSITVESGSSLLNTTDATVSTVIDRRFVENIPLNGRSFQDLISMTPGVATQSPQSGSTLGVNGDFSVNGQRTQSNEYTVDGVTGNIASGSGYGGPGAGTGGSLGGATALGTTQTLISVAALPAFRVQSSTYSAEYGRSPGGQFSLVTRSGTNLLHGTAFDYLRNNFFDANDWFNDYYGKPAPALRQNDFGGTLGGPIRISRFYNGTDRTFFFVSYEGLRLTQPTAAVIQYVPDTFMRKQAAPGIQPILNAYPLQNGIDYGTSTSPSLAQFIEPFSLPSAIDSTSVRIDHTVKSKLSLFFRYGTTPSYTSSRSAFALNKARVNADTYTWGATYQLSSRLTNDFRFGYAGSTASQTGALDDFGGATPIDLAAAMGAGSFAASEPVMYFSIAGIGTSEMLTTNAKNLSHQWNLVDTFNLPFGRHNLRFGINYRHISSPLILPNPEMFVEFITTTAILNNAPQYPYIYPFISATPIFNDTAIFAQDEWRVRPNLSLSFGLRWEVTPPPTEAHGNDAYTVLGSVNNPASLTLAPQGTPLWKTGWFDLAPRLGVAWIAHASRNAETVVHAGGGVFFDSADEIATRGYEGFGFSAYQLLAGASLPFTSAQLSVPISTKPPYTTGTIYAFPEHLQMPYTLEWNASVQQALGDAQALTISYVGANGRRLIAGQQVTLTKLNPNFGSVLDLQAGVTSNYQALQLQFKRSVTRGIHALASYTWSHSLDFGSNDATIALTRGNSDYDVRHNVQAGLSWDLPTVNGPQISRAVLGGWGLDARLNARTAFPVTLGGTSVTDPATGRVYQGGLNFVSGKSPYLFGPQYPGGRILSKAAFSVPATGTIGDAPRNFVRGLDATQLNFVLRRDFHLYDRFVLQFRAESFNILNHPNFGYIDPTYTDATFGQATKMLNASLGTLASQYQQGGPRSMQFAVKLKF